MTGFFLGRRSRNDLNKFVKNRNESTDVIVICRLLFDVINAHVPQNKGQIMEKIVTEAESFAASLRIKSTESLRGKKLKIKGLPVLICIEPRMEFGRGSLSHPTIFIHVESTSLAISSISDLKKSIINDAISDMLD